MVRRSSRQTKGVRSTVLAADAKVADDEFWNNLEEWKDSSGDEEVKSQEFDSDEAQDTEDSDIDDLDESRVYQEEKKKAEGIEKELNKRKRKKQKLGVPPRPKHKPKGDVEKKPVIRDFRRAETDESAVKRAVRSSTVQKTISVGKSYEEREIKRLKRKEKRQMSGKVREKRVFSQREYLEEAIRVETENKRQLFAMLMLREEEHKKTKAVLENKKERPKNYIRTVYSANGTRMIFSKPDLVQIGKPARKAYLPLKRELKIEEIS